MRIGPHSTLHSDDDRPVLIAALSGRALAAAAARAGDRVIVLDRFADEDTVRTAVGCAVVPKGRYGFARAALLAAVRRLQGQVRGLVYGAGLEHSPAVLAELADIVPLLGNPPEVLAVVKDPFRFAALLSRHGLPHPATRRAAPASPGWIRKAAGGSGGAHIGWAAPGPAPTGTYAQRLAPGRSVSALFLADGSTARVLGVTEQWASPTGRAPFRYGGCAGPVRLSSPLIHAIETACRAIAGAVPLVGLNSLDMLVDGLDVQILEVNPRPGASLDALDGIGGLSLWRAHLDALAGRLPEQRTDRAATRIRAAQVMYAPQRLTIPPAFAWPRWSADRGRPGTAIGRGEPICTIHAVAATPTRAREGVQRRAALLLARLVEGRPFVTTGERHAEEAAMA